VTLSQDAGGSRGRSTLRSRIRGLLRPEAPTAAPTDVPQQDLDEIVARLDHLESLVEGLQDALYHESQRQKERNEEFEARLHPESIARALSENERRRGL
jgi:hypothetical protein